MPTIGELAAGYGHGSGGAEPQDSGERGERGYRRRRLAAVAENLYRSSQQAVTDMREAYAQSRARGSEDGTLANDSSPDIPSAFPDVAIASHGDEQMVLFPSYAKKHAKRDWGQVSQISQTDMIKDDDYWHQEWERHEQAKAIVDVDVRGWIYSTQVGPMTRRNRILIGLARQLSGISLPYRTEQGYGAAGELHSRSHHGAKEELRDREKIVREAALIEQRGQEEVRVAHGGGYSEPQAAENGGPRINSGTGRGRTSRTPNSWSPVPPARQPSSVEDLSEAELVLANTNLMARMAPFLANPLVALPMTVFFYNETQSRSRTVVTDDAGHFAIRAQLDFVPSNVRVLANERLSAMQDVNIIEPWGVSLISDIDDTIKHSNISAGAREIFRNTFVRELSELTIEGVREWYNQMKELGVSIHYCSNSPWQLFPVLESFLKLGGLPPGSLHLKKYSGMLQGIFEPVAERKKSTLNRLLADFPERRFLLVGDSGEADLEVYTELALANPDRILAIFIRDVTTPEDKREFWDSAALELAQRTTSTLTLGDGRRCKDDEHKTITAVRSDTSSSHQSSARRASGPCVGTLIDFSEEPEQTAASGQPATLDPLHKANGLGKERTAGDMPIQGKPRPPPRPAKPAALRGSLSPMAGSNRAVGLEQKASRPAEETATLPGGRAVDAGGSQGQRPPEASQTKQAPRTTSQSANGNMTSGTERPRPPPPRRTMGPPASSMGLGSNTPADGRGHSSKSAVDLDYLPPPSTAPQAALGSRSFGSASRSRGTSPTGSPASVAPGVTKKLDLWLRRLVRAHEQLDRQGVALYTWKRGQDVTVEAVAMVKQALEEARTDRKEASGGHFRA